MTPKKTPLKNRVISIDKIIEELYDSPYVHIDPVKYEDDDEEYPNPDFNDYFENEEDPWDDNERYGNSKKQSEYLRAKTKINKHSAADLRSFASEVMDELEKNGLEDFVLLKNDKLREWWAAEKKIRVIKEERAKEKERVAEVKKLAKERYDHMMSTFTNEEKRLLGIKK